MVDFPSVNIPSTEDLERAREVIGEVMAPTPLIEVVIDGRRIWCKLDSLAPTGSFKVRGALAAIHHARLADPGRSVVTCSAGNHGLGIAFAAKRLGVDACVVVPETASPVKIAKLESFGIELQLVGATYDEAERHAMTLADQRDARYVSPYNDTQVVAGQASMAAEVADQLGESGHLVVAVGGGGLAAGSALAMAKTDWVVHGAQVEQNAAFAAVFRGGSFDESSLLPTIADGVAGGFDPTSVTLEILRSAAFDLSLVTEVEVRRATRRSLVDIGVVAEGSAGLSLAVALRHMASWDGEIVVGLCGRNITNTLIGELLTDQTL